jgi:hypothetical protein
MLSLACVVMQQSRMWVNGMSGTGFLRKPLKTRQQLNIIH